MCYLLKKLTRFISFELTRYSYISLQILPSIVFFQLLINIRNNEIGNDNSECVNTASLTGMTMFDCTRRINFASARAQSLCCSYVLLNRGNMLYLEMRQHVNHHNHSDFENHPTTFCIFFFFMLRRVKSSIDKYLKQRLRVYILSVIHPCKILKKNKQ